MVLTGTNKLSDGTTEDHKGTIFSKGKLFINGDGSWRSMVTTRTVSMARVISS